MLCPSKAKMPSNSIQPFRGSEIACATGMIMPPWGHCSDRWANFLDMLYKSQNTLRAAVNVTSNTHRGKRETHPYPSDFQWNLPPESGFLLPRVKPPRSQGFFFPCQSCSPHLRTHGLVQIIFKAQENTPSGLCHPTAPRGLVH